MDYFDPFAAEPRARLASSTTKFLVLSFDSDWRFPTSHSRHIADELEEAGVAAEIREISSPHGHDSFLLPVAAYHDAIRSFLQRATAPMPSSTHA